MRLSPRVLCLAGFLTALSVAPSATLGAQGGSTRTGDDRGRASSTAPTSGGVTPSGVAVAAGVLHTDAAGFGASLTGSYVLSMRRLALSLSPVDLGIGFGGADGYHEDLLAGSLRDACFDRNNVEVSRFRCNASVRYGASAQLVAVLSADPEHAMGIGVGYRAFDAPSAYAVVSADLGIIRDARVHLRVRGGSHFYDLAIGASFPLPHEPERAPSVP
jgi:hypothetical protein